MKEIIIILILILVLYLTVRHKNNYPKTELNLITKDKVSKLKHNKNDYYTKPVKRVRFADTPEYMKCPYGRTSYTDNPKDEEDVRNRFIDEYVFNNRVNCNNKPNDTNIELDEYRRDVFDFRNKTNQIANNHSPVDNINEVIVNNPDLSGMKISDIYDKLTSNDFNTTYTKIDDNDVIYGTVKYNDNVSPYANY